MDATDKTWFRIPFFEDFFGVAKGVDAAVGSQEAAGEAEGAEVDMMKVAVTGVSEQVMGWRDGRLAGLEGKERQKAENALINAESAVGREIFGAVPVGVKREFFQHQRGAWIWFENGVTVRYELRGDRVLKRVGTGGYVEIMGVELANFQMAVRHYGELVGKRVYGA